MIGLDTNILIRYLVQDDARQSQTATRIIEGELSADNPGFVSIVVMAETAWVLERAYRLTAVEIASAIKRMLQIDVLAIEDEQQVFAATIALEEGMGAFADVLIAALGEKAGCLHTLTFDRKAARLAGFELA